MSPAVVLPAPSGNPQSIDFNHDPLLQFMRDASPSMAFLEGVGEAVERHPAVTAAIAEQQATQAVRTQVRAGLFPRIDAQLVYGRALARDFGDRTAIAESLQPRARTDLTATGDQLLYDFGATGNRIAAANDRIGAAGAEVQRVASETALRAVTACYDVLNYQTLSELSAAMALRQAEILADVRMRVAQGLGAIGDITRTEAVLADTRAQGTRYDRYLEQARSRYHEAFGTDPPQRLFRTEPPRSAAHSLDAAQALAIKSPVVQAALRRAEAAERDYRAAKSDRLPRLSAGINISRYDVFKSSDYEIRGTLVLRQSLFAGGRQRGIIDQASAQARNADALADRVNAESKRDASIAFTDVAALERTSATLETAYIANRRSRDAYVEQFRVSRGTLIELLRSEQDYLSAATSYLQAALELDVARYTLLDRTGEILPAVGVEFSTSSM
jgi:adhesin transport system outer membrane protein